MDAASVIALLNTAVPGADFEPQAPADQPTVVVPRDCLLETCRALREHPALRFTLLADVTAVDWWPREPRFEVIYHFASVEGPVKSRLRVKVRLGGEDAHLATVKDVWPSANWLEREVWDLFGIVFDEHDDLRRILLPDDWEGYPLRKDYPVQIKMTPKGYEPLQLTEQEFQANLDADRHARGGSKRDRGRSSR